MKKETKYSHIKKAERLEIAILLKKGYGIRDIAQVLQRNLGAISREISRNGRKTRRKGGTESGPYKAKTAQHKARLRRRYSKFQGKKIWQNDLLRGYIKQRLRKGWNPEVISGRMKLENQPFYASKTAIYEFVYSPYGQGLCRYLPSKRPHRRKRKEKKTKRVLIPNRTGIELRPKK